MKKLNLLLITLFLLSSACSGVDKSSVRPTAGAPESVRVDSVSLPYDSSMPTYLIAIEPIRLTGNIAVQVEKRVGTLTGQGSGQSSSNTSDNSGYHHDTRVVDQRHNQVTETEDKQPAQGKQKGTMALPVAPGSPVIAVSMGQGGGRYPRQ